jgi:hypothetical protein
MAQFARCLAGLRLGLNSLGVAQLFYLDRLDGLSERWGEAHEERILVGRAEGTLKFGGRELHLQRPGL